MNSLGLKPWYWLRILRNSWDEKVSRKDLSKSFTINSILPAIASLFFYSSEFSLFIAPRPAAIAPSLPRLSYKSGLFNLGFSELPLCIITKEGAGTEIPLIFMLCSPDGPAIEFWSAIGWPYGTPILTTEKTLPFYVLITVDLARMPGKELGPLLSSCKFVLDAVGFC